jgi:hypothetical protein
MKIVKVSEDQFISIWAKAYPQQRCAMPIPVRNIYFGDADILVVTGNPSVQVIELDPNETIESIIGLRALVKAA